MRRLRFLSAARLILETYIKEGAQEAPHLNAYARSYEVAWQAMATVHEVSTAQTLAPAGARSHSSCL